MKNWKGVLCLLLFALPTSTSAQWGPEIKLSSGEENAGLNENMGQTIVTSGKTVHVVWHEGKKNDSAIYYRRSSDGGATWGSVTRVSGSSSLDGSPLLAVSGSTVHLVFLRNGGTPEAASYYKRSTDGGNTWGPDVLLAKTKWWPSVAASGSNVYVALNTQPEEGNSEVYFRRSTDNGATWQPQQQISNAKGRSEDPGIFASGKYVHMVWNDNRDVPPREGMAVYYRRSSDMGATWGPETALTHAPEFTYFPNVNASGSHVDIAYGDKKSGHYQIYHLHSADFGSTWDAKEQITHTSSVGEGYPAILRDGRNVHLIWGRAGTIMYQHSGDGGASWDPVVPLTKGFTPFIAVSGEAVHLLFSFRTDDHSAIYYKRNPTGNSSPGSK